MFARLLTLSAVVAAGAPALGDPAAPLPGALRVATYNVALYGERSGELADRLETGDDRQARALAEVIQRVRPDLLLLCEIDFEADRRSVDRFADAYLGVSQAGSRPIAYPHRFSAPVNTGAPSGLDLNGDGDLADPDDCYGYGRYPGQYGMAVLSRLPIDANATRTFQRLLWADLPGARRPRLPGGDFYYADDVWTRMRLPSKSLWDVAVLAPRIGRLRLIASHPTPPVFDGPEDRNGYRNADEVRLVREYVEGGLADYFVDDRGERGAIAAGEPFVVLGDLNADPNDGDGHREAIRRLLASDRLAADPAPTSPGASPASRRFAPLNEGHAGDPACDTGNFGPDGHANLRIDYALPSRGLAVVGSGVYWPAPGEPGAAAAAASDHRLVWVDLAPAEE